MFGATFIINLISVITSENKPPIVAEKPVEKPSDKVQVQIPEIEEELTYDKAEIPDGKHDITSAPIIFESGNKPLSGTVEIQNGELKDYTFVYEDKYVSSTDGNTEIKDIVKNPAQQVKPNETLFFNVKDYGAKGDGTTDDTMAIRKAVDNLNKKGGTLYFPKGTYIVSTLAEDFKAAGKLNANGEIKSNANSADVAVIKLTNTIVKYTVDFGGATLKLTTNSYPVYAMVSALNCKNVEIKNGTLIGDADTHIYKYIQKEGYATDDGTEYRKCQEWIKSSSAIDYIDDDKINYIDYFIWVKKLTSQYGSHGFGFGISLGGVRDARITSMTIKNMTGDAIIVSGSGSSRLGTAFSDSNTIIDKCDLSYCRRLGISILDSDTTIVKNTKIYKIGNNEKMIGTAPMYGIDIEPDSRSFTAKKVVVDNCEIVQNTGGVIVDGFKRGLDIQVTNSKIENTGGLINTSVAGTTGKIENCDIYLVDRGDNASGRAWEISHGQINNCRYYFENYTPSKRLTLFINNSIIKNCTFKNLKSENESNTMMYIIGGGELSNCKFYNIKGSSGIDSGILNGTWGISFAINNTGTFQATGELVNINNYYENCDVWCQVFKDSQGFGIVASEFNKCRTRVYNMFLRDTKINKSITYLIKYIKKYNCYIDGVYTNND